MSATMTNSSENEEGRYRGIFSSSLCDMFLPGEASRTDACALACCGVFLWDRNHYLLEGSTPKPWRRRPIEMLIVGLAIAAAIVWTLEPKSLFLQIAGILILALILWKMLEFQHARAYFRHRLAMDSFLREHPELRDDPNLPDNYQLHLYLEEHQLEIHGGSHAVCGCSRIDRRCQEGSHNDTESRDFCSRLWKFLASMCCSACCACWCQWCGVCAIAQEHRHLKRILPKDPDLWERDYITLQPWKTYFPEICRLRRQKETSFVSHYQALSLLSSRLVKALLVFLAASVAVSFLPVHYSRWELVVLFATFLYSSLFLFFVHWFWNRFDISLDAVIKYFAAGFFICTTMAIVFEIVVSLGGAIVVVLLTTFAAEEVETTKDADQEVQATDDAATSSSSEDLWETLDIPQPWLITIAVVGAFLNAFVTAGLVEEISKYLSFWMMEHPDLASASAGVSKTSPLETPSINDSDEIREGKTEGLGSLPKTVSNSSRSRAITIAMVTVATGFACAENLLYVFVYTPPGIAAEAATLFVRCMFPVHPLAAALQSIGVCRRELEGDSRVGTGRIIFPAWLMHGLFDFTLMSYTVVKSILEQDDEIEEESSEENETAFSPDEMKVIAAVFVIPFVGLLYYIREANAQRKRLVVLDNRRDGVSRSVVLGTMS